MSGTLMAWWQRYRESPARDIVFTLAITVVLLLGSYGEAHPGTRSDQVVNGHRVPYTPDAAFVLVAIACLVLVARRRHPLVVLSVCTAAVVIYSALGYVNGAVLLAPSIALYPVARDLPPRRSLLAAGITFAALAIASLAGNPFGPLGGGVEVLPALIGVPLFGGIAVRNRNAYVASIQARADDEAKRRVDEERLRIARELHDVVAHTMATINVQAGVANHVLADNPAAAGDALQAIRQSSKDGLRELRAILNVLRQADEGESTQPAPGLAQVETLIEKACKSGLPTRLTRAGEPGQLPPAVDLAAYRIVQEALTNVIKHAGPASATVTVSFDDGVLRIDVTDTGRGGQPAALGSGDGQGIIGMRERASSVGGTLEAGPGPAGGYQVTAVLPTEERHPEHEAESSGPESSGSASAADHADRMTS